MAKEKLHFCKPKPLCNPQQQQPEGGNNNNWVLSLDCSRCVAEGGKGCVRWVACWVAYDDDASVAAESGKMGHRTLTVEQRREKK